MTSRMRRGRATAAPGSCGKGRRSVGAEQPALPQCFKHCGEMVGGRAVEAFEPVLVEKRGERRLGERRLTEDSEQRGRRLVLLARQRRQDRGTLGSIAIERVGTRSEPEFDEPPPLARGEHTSTISSPERVLELGPRTTSPRRYFARPAVRSSGICLTPGHRDLSR